MADDFVKNILLRFKIDDRDLKKVQEGLMRGGPTSGPGAAASAPIKGLPDAVRQILQMSREMDKIGLKMNKSFDNMAKAAKAIAGDHLKQAERQLDQISRKAELRIRAVDRLRQSGASQDAVTRMQARADESLGAAGSKLREIQELRGPQGPSMLQIAGGGLQIAGAALGVGAQVVGTFQRSEATNAQYTGAAGNELVRRRTDLYQGNLLNSIMNVRNRQDQKAIEYAKSQRNKEDWKQGLMTGAGVLGGIGSMMAAGAVAGSVVPGLGTVAGGLVGGIVGMGGAALAAGSAMRGAEYFMTPGRRAGVELQKFQEGRDLIQQQSIDPYLYQRFKENSPAYARANRLLGFNSDQASQFRQSSFGSMMTATEAAGIATGFRPQFGSAAGVGLTKQVQGARLTTGFDSSTLASILGQQAKFGTGGTSEAGRNFEKIMSVSFSKGIEDSGLTEKMAQLVSAYQASQTVTTDSGRVAAQIMSGIAPGQENNPRAIEAAVAAQQAAAGRYQEGGYVGFKKMRMSGTLANQVGLKGQEAGDFQLAMAGASYEEGMKILERYHANPEAMKTYNKFQTESLKTTRSSTGAIEQIEKYRDAGIPIPEELKNAAITAYQAAGRGGSEQAAAEVQRVMNGGTTAITEKGTSARALAAGKATAELVGGPGATAEGRQEALAISGAGKEDQAISDNIRKNMNAAVELFQEQGEAASNFGENVDLTSDKAKALAGALDDLITAINSKTRALGGAVRSTPSATSTAGQKNQ